MRTREPITLYLPLNAGLGVLYSIGFLLLSRLRGMRVFIHHHSNAYIRSRGVLTSLATRVAGLEATHIFLCKGMERGFDELYGPVRSVAVDNAAFWDLSQSADPLVPSETIRLLHVSNLTPEKGLLEVFEIARRVLAEGWPVEVHLAGPLAGGNRAAFLKEIEGLSPAMNYHGPVYGAEKEELFRSADVFLFPTQYRNEAQPLVIIEAMAAGNLVVSNNRGCIEDDLRGWGILVERSDDFVATVSDVIGAMLADRAAFLNTRRGAVQAIRTRVLEGQASLEELVSAISSDGFPDD